MDLFIIKLLLSFIIGGVWVTIAVSISERISPNIGGIIIGFPSTILYGMFFIGWTQSAAIASEATDIIPLLGVVLCLFTLIFIFLTRFGFWIAIGSALASWFIAAFVIIKIGYRNFWVSLIFYVIAIIISYHILNNLNIKYKPIKLNESYLRLVFRGLFSGTVISTAVLLAKIGGPLLGGAFTMFPATFSSTILITYLDHGKEFTAMLMKKALISSINVFIYAISVRMSYVYLGLWYGTLVSILISGITSLILYRTNIINNL